MGLLNELGMTAPPSISDAEKQMASGGLPPEGVHHAVLEAVGGIPNADGRGWKMTFKIIAGPGKDMSVEDIVWKAKGDDAKKDARVNNRILIYAHRLGLLKKVNDASGKEVAVEVEGKHEFSDCLGAPCFIELKHEDEEYEKNGKKHSIKKAKLTFEGVLSPDDKKVKDVPKAGNVPAASSVGRPGGAAKKDDFGDI